MFPRLLLILAVSVILGGCQKQESASESSASTAPTASATDPSANSDAASPTPSDEARLAATLDELTQALRKFSAEKQRVPKKLDELVAAGYLGQIPPAPAGKKFVIEEKRVQVIVGN